VPAPALIQKRAADPFLETGRHMTARKPNAHQRPSFAARWRMPFEKKPAGVTPSASPSDCRLDLSGAIAIYAKPALAW